MLTLKDVFFAFVWIALLILAGRIIKQKIGWIQRLYLPESIVAGALALLLGPQVLGAIATRFSGEGALLSQGLFPENIRSIWSQSPGIFINIVFAALFLGEVIPSPKARKKQHISVARGPVDQPDDLPALSHSENDEVLARRQHLTRGLLIDPLSLNFGFVGIAVIIGWIIQQGLVLLEALTWGRTGFAVMEYVPLFPMALIGGIIVQIVMVRLRLDPLIIPRLTKNIAGMALDVVVVTALASISLTVIGGNLGVFLTLSIAGIAWNILFFIYFAPRIFPDYWFEKGIGDLGQSMGVTATGILLLRMVDPENRSGAFESFAYKQLFFEPIVGGGLFTAAAPALIAKLGLMTTLFITGGLLLFWMFAGFLLIKQRSRVAPVQ